MSDLQTGLAEQSNVFGYGFLLLCVPCEFEIESLGQVPSAFVGCQVMDSAPKVEHVAGGSAWRMETLEDILAQVNGDTPAIDASECPLVTNPRTPVTAGLFIRRMHLQLHCVTPE